MGGGTRPGRRQATLILDTHALIWSRNLDARLGMRARNAIEQTWQSDSVAVSAFSFWEIAMLRSKERIGFPEDISLWRLSLLDQGLIEIPVDGEIGICANLLQDFHADPADRIIVATALQGHRLVTSDERILNWSGSLARLDARK